MASRQLVESKEFGESHPCGRRRFVTRSRRQEPDITSSKISRNCCWTGVSPSARVSGTPARCCTRSRDSTDRRSDRDSSTLASCTCSASRCCSAQPPSSSRSSSAPGCAFVSGCRSRRLWPAARRRCSSAAAAAVAVAAAAAVLVVAVWQLMGTSAAAALAD